MRISFTSLSEIANSSWEVAQQALADDLSRLQATINKTWEVAHLPDGHQKGLTDGLALGIVTGTLAEQPTGLSAGNDGLLYFVTDFNHLVRWDGTASVWKFAAGDPGNGFFMDYAITPQEVGWALSDGSVTNYLVVGGASLTTSSFTLPNLTTGSYRRGGAYTGALLGAVAPGITTPANTGSNGAHTHGGATGAEASHTHGAGSYGTNLGNNVTDSVSVGAGLVVADEGHTHVVTGTSGAGSSHAHSISSDGAHTHTITAVTSDTAARPPTLVVTPYFRR